jgi:uncharacterized protein YabN with tetrapyrrole methylase and pyrophosphatase domain
MDLLEQVVNLEHAASEFGFRWETSHQIITQIQSECLEINEHLIGDISSINQAELQEEIGDLLHAVFSLCVFCDFSPRETLAHTLAKFERRFNAVKEITAEHGLSNLNGHSFDELMQIWHAAKVRCLKNS